MAGRDGGPSRAGRAVGLPAGALRGVRSRLPEPARALGRRARAELRSLRPARPALSVVIPAYNVEAFLAECLDSILGQTLRDLEVIVVDDGSTDATRAIARRFARSDERVRVFGQQNSGQGVARNRGVGHARGEFLTFVDADDTVPRRAFSHMLDILRRTGSDFCVGSTRRFSNQHFSPTVWDKTVHIRNRFRTTVEEFPLAMQDILACNRMFRTDFWRREVGGFRGDVAYEDHVPMLTAYVRATAFDVLAAITYNWRLREDETSTSQQKARIENLLDRIAVKEEAHELLLREAPRSVHDMWVARAIEIDLAPFISHALSGTDMYRAVLSAALGTFLDRASPESMAQVRFMQKSRGWLAAQQRWHDLESAEEYFRVMRFLPTTRVEHGRIVAEPLDFLHDAPESIRELSPVETRFDGALEHVRWLEDGRLEISGWAFIRALDMPEPDRAEAWLVETGSGRRMDLPLDTVQSPVATIWGNDLHARYDGGGFRVVVDADGLPAGRWQLMVRVGQRGVERTHSVHWTVNGSSAARPRPHAVGTRVLRPQMNGEHGFVIDVAPAPAVLHGATIDEDGVARGTVRTPAAETLRGLFLRSGQAREPVATEPAATGWAAGSPDGTRSWAVAFPVPSGTATWTLHADLGDSRTPPVLLGSTEPPTCTERAWTSGPRGGARLSGPPTTPHVTALTVSGDTLVADLHAGDPGEVTRIRLENERCTVPATVEPLGADRYRATFGLHTSSFGGPPLVLPSGTFHIRGGPAKTGLPTGLPADQALCAELPLRLHHREVALRVNRTPGDGALLLTVSPPLRPDELGPAGQRRLQTAYQSSSAPLVESVLFQCYLGEFATDSQRALDEGLRAARPELTRYWGVRDFSVAVPDGSIPLLIGSREWYDALATSRYLCHNIDFDAFFRKRPGQRYLQTFHGYPFKSMGRGFWAGKGFSEERISREIARRNEEYDAIVVPSERAADFYRAEYDYTGKILVTGYPRSDFIVNAAPAEVRTEVRAEVLDGLGVDPAQTVVLYAPTYRDHLTTRTYAARRFDELDLDALTRALGPGYTLLVRGHNNNQREPDRVTGVAQVVDVTDHPEVNELTVAADAAILDYSSLRFDWALTGKPVVFFVPDLESYFAQRPPLFPFTESAPGPLLSTTGEVAATLRDLPGLQAAHRADLAAFNAEFNSLHDGHATERVIGEFFGPG